MAYVLLLTTTGMIFVGCIAAVGSLREAATIAVSLVAVTLLARALPD